MKLAIVYDWIDSWGGAERVLQTFAEMFPDADWYTMLYEPKTAEWAKNLHIKSSFIQKLPPFIRKSRRLSLPFMPFAVESFDLSDYTHVISITSTFSKAVITRPETRHISYILSPPRFLWTHQKDYGTDSPFLKPYIHYLQKWDVIAAHRPDVLVAISEEVQKRIKKIYNLDADVVYPPFNSAYWEKLSKGVAKKSVIDSYLLVSRLEPYKRIDLAIKAFRQMPYHTLTIIGDGKLYEYLRTMATRNVIFIKNTSDKELAAHYATSKALIMPQIEDFGYVALEAQACGCPVIAYNKGGARETITEGKTGILFDEQTPAALIKAIEKCETQEYTMRHSSLDRFSEETFKKKFITLMQ